ncbi:MAG: hypothetical protein Q4P15_13595, partial [Propionibacteriaceae bacterium]|nr:hypothetical protein [Propionibacteriaceae bacterium]
MTSGDNGEWVRQGTPQDDNANWNEEPSEYGTAISPAEWDDYSSEQPVPVAPPRAHTDGGAETAGSPGSPMQHDSAPVLGQEPDAPEEYGADELEPFAVDAKVSDTDDEGRDSARIDDLADGEDTQAIPEYDSDEPVEEMTRPRPVAHDDTGATAVADDATFESAVEPTDDGMEPVAAEEVSGEERHVDAADYLALDPVPADELTGEPLIEANDQALIEANDEPLAAAEDDE